MKPIRNFATSRFVFSLCLLAGLALAGAGSAGAGHGHGGHGFLLERQIDKLELPAETRTAVQAVLDQSRPAQDELRQQMRSAHESMRALLDQDSVDEAAVMAQADTLGKLMTERRKQDLRTLIQVRSLLTEEQRAALDQRMEKRGMRGGHGKHGKGDCSHGEKSAEAPAETQS